VERLGNGEQNGMVARLGAALDGHRDAVEERSTPSAYRA
jgi:hypothetical protein